MGTKLNPYLTFDGLRAAEAMEFYREVFGGELQVMRFSDMPTTDGSPAPEGVMHSQLDTEDGFTLMGSDGDPGRSKDSPSPRASVSLSGDDEATLRSYWDRLSARSTVITPLEPQMWGDTFGMCTDPYGTTWLVNISVPVPAGA